MVTDQIRDRLECEIEHREINPRKQQDAMKDHRIASLEKEL